MTFEQLMAERGYWDNEFAMVKTPDGYARCVAIKNGDSQTLTAYGGTLITPTLANVSTDVVVSTPKKRAKKVVEPEVQQDSLDDLDI
jgi:hypothetical protein